MATYTWPAGLPQDFLQDGYSDSPPDVLIRTEMDAGPAKVRRRMTSNVRPITASITVTSAQLDTFESFFNTTLSGGVSRFNYTHPVHGAVEMRFSGVPSYAKIGGDRWRIDMALEVMP